MSGWLTNLILLARLHFKEYMEGMFQPPASPAVVFRTCGNLQRLRANVLFLYWRFFFHKWHHISSVGNLDPVLPTYTVCSHSSIQSFICLKSLETYLLLMIYETSLTIYLLIWCTFFGTLAVYIVYIFVSVLLRTGILFSFIYMRL